MNIVSEDSNIMPPAMCPPPDIFQNAFENYELDKVSYIFEYLEEAAKREEICLILTDPLKELLRNTNLSNLGSYWGTIGSILWQWILQPHRAILTVNTQLIDEFSNHPLPTGIGDGCLVDTWMMESGRLLVIHQHCNEGQNYFIGVLCPDALNGNEKRTYNTEGLGFPLVGPDDLNTLEDAYEFIVPHGYGQRVVNERLVRKNYHAIGASYIDDARGEGDHFLLIFDSGHSWPYDPSWDHIPPHGYLQLREITGLSTNVIKYCLTEGEEPEKRHRLREYLS